MTRYVAKIEVYLWADHDKQAEIKARELAELLEHEDNARPEVLRITENPFGSFINREVWKR